MDDLKPVLGALLFIFVAALVSAAEPPSPTQAFVQALESTSSTAEQRAEAWKKLTQGDRKPSKAVADLVDKARGRAWEQLASLVRSLAPQKAASGLRAAISPHQAKVRDVVNGEGFSHEKLDTAMAPIQKAFDAVMDLLKESDKYKALRSLIDELEGYAVGCGLRHGWNGELLDTLCTLEVVSRYAGSPRWSPLLETNQLVGSWIDPGEAACLTRLNAHRILIGLAPMEFDLRLVIAGKKHSEEMAAKNYFAHDSPTEALKTPWARAGREQTGAGGECIAGGQGTGVGAFTAWYYSQGHHKIMISGATCSGVGRAGDKWTLMVGGNHMPYPKTDKMATYVRKRYETGDKPEPLFELAKWCASNQLLVQAQDELERVVVLDANNEPAKKALERIRSHKR